MSVRGTIFLVNVFFDNAGLCHTVVEVNDGVVEFAEKGTVKDEIKTLNTGESAAVVSRVDEIYNENSSVNSGNCSSGGNGTYSPVNDFEYRYVQRLGGIEITKYLGNDEVVNIPAEIEGKPVVIVSGFSKTNVKSVTIPDGVTEIGNEAFYWCKELTTVEIPDSVTRIGQRAFTQCEKLQNVRIPDGVTKIETAAFGYCIELTSINIPNGVTSIGNYAFSTCLGIESITIPNSVTEIGEGAFQSCAELTSIEIPDSVKKIEQYAFRGCHATITYKGKTYLYTDNIYEDLYTE